jgi:hypothetical protein
LGKVARSFAALAVAIVGGAAWADVPTDPLATLRDNLAACTAPSWNSDALEGHGWQRGSHWNLAARGQRVQDYDKPATGGHLSLNSSFMYYVACSTSADFAKPEDRGPAQAALVADLKLEPAGFKSLVMSSNTAAFMKEYGLDKEQQLLTNGKYFFAFVQRQVDGRNILAVYVIDPLEGKP